MRLLLVGKYPKEVVEAFRLRATDILHVTEIKPIELPDQKFDCVLVFCPDDLCNGTIRNAQSFLRSEGELFLIVRRRLFSKAKFLTLTWQELRKKLSKNGFKHLQFFGLAPSLEDFRLIIPLSGNRVSAASLALYQPSLGRARVRKILAYTLARCGLTYLWTPYFLVIGNKRESFPATGLDQLITKIYGERVKTALFTGTPGFFRKPTIQVMRPSGEILGFGKIAISNQAKELLEHEHKMLQFLQKLDLGGAFVPDVKYFGLIPTIGKLLLQSSKKRPLSRSHLDPNTLHLDFLSRLHHQTATTSEALKERFFEQVGRRLDWLQGKISAGLGHCLQTSLMGLRNLLYDKDIPFGMAHRDFTPWNTYLYEGHLGIFDWEFAEKSWPPLQDAFHFIIQKRIIVDKWKPEKLLGEVIRPHEKGENLIDNLLVNLTLPNDYKFPLLKAYLVDMITAYSYKNFHDPFLSPEDELVIATWSSMLEQINATPGGGKFESLGLGLRL